MRTLMIPVRARRALASDLFSQMNREFDRLFDDFGSPEAKVTDHFNSEREVWAQAYTDEAQNHYLISVDLPGTKRDDIKIEVLEGMLTITGERKDSGRQMNFKRSFALPQNVKSESVEAHYEDGVLKLFLPKTEEARPRKVEIQSGQTGFWENLLGSKKAQSEPTNVTPKH